MERLPLTRERLIDLLARTLVGALFLLLSMNLLEDFLRTQRITGLLLLVSESLVVVLTVMRRRALLVDTSAAALAITAIALVGPPLLRTGNAPGLLPDALTALISGAAICLVIAGKITLGRSFGIVPANRGVVDKGPYLLVRHPIYAGYLVSHLAFVMAYPLRGTSRCWSSLMPRWSGARCSRNGCSARTSATRRTAGASAGIWSQGCSEICNIRLQISGFRFFRSLTALT